MSGIELADGDRNILQTLFDSYAAGSLRIHPIQVLRTWATAAKRQATEATDERDKILNRRYADRWSRAADALAQTMSTRTVAQPVAPQRRPTPRLDRARALFEANRRPPTRPTP